MLIVEPYHTNDASAYSGRVKITPSEQQGQFFTFFVREAASGLLVAAAGSGKTTTIVNACHLLPPGVATRFVAFNKSIATELEARLPRTVQSSTFHSAWFQALQRSLPSRPKVDANKVRELLKANLNYREFETYFQFVTRLVGYAKSTGLGALVPDTEAEWFNLISYFGLQAQSDDLDEATAVRHARATLAASNAALRVIDFDDMLYLPLLRNVVCDKSNIVFVDEAQDLNSVQRTLLLRMLPTEASGAPRRLIAVGDPHQAIYGFRGADCDSMEQLQAAFNARVLPLSVSYRCSQAVVREAQKALNQ